MLYSYAQLRDAVELRGSRYLPLFERYCTAMRANTRVLEWSCKVLDGRFEGARFLHTARQQTFAAAQPAVDKLLAGVGTGSFGWLRELAGDVGEGVALGYAEWGQAGARRAELKLYVSTSRVAAVSPVIAAFVPAGASPPDGTHKVMVAASIDETGEERPRAYYLWRREGGDPGAWLQRWCSPEERELIEANDGRTLSIAFKAERRDMIYLTAPFAQETVRRMVAAQLGPHELAVGQLENLRWIGFSKRGEGLASRELNAYFRTSGMGHA
ncbi:hypothetical protein OM076_13455 [Solirubrobacter ginsenosidimutans]|uniref:Uncharacterized protein n=1 Tax=Solirubrobacter ginsenosidimutans TaxID=490573 RepID=A0A9X3S556_9ACTN|nr:hypothetical protein [Solirubrobacter ginsenosidimutans]MDA0161278.1 hypothetical protein [Solirubrobacter ginsenosidimutans]